MTTSADERIKIALQIIQTFGTIDGDHHKTWVIDQIVRVLTGCSRDSRTPEYDAFRNNFLEDDDGEPYDHWKEGIAP